MKVLIDTNIFIDIAQKREGLVDASRAVTTAVFGKRVVGVVCAHSVTTIYYLLKKSNGHESASKLIKQMIGIYQIEKIDKTLLQNSLTVNFADYEDAVVYCSALACKADYIVTRNVKDFKKSKIKVVSPEQLIKLIK